MNAFYADGHCAAHYVKRCRFCTRRAPRPTTEARLVALLQSMPDVVSLHDLREELQAAKLKATPENDAETRRHVARLIRFHLASREGNFAGFAHQIADELFPETEVRDVA